MNVFVIDDHPLMREAVVMLIRRIVPEARIAELDRLAMVVDQETTVGSPDFVCLDLKLPDTHGVSGVREIRARYPHIPIIVLSASPAADFEALSLEAGADLYLEKSLGAAHLTQSLRAILVQDSDSLIHVQEPEKLSRRQTELIQLIDRGLSNRDLATELKISEHTVKVHLWRLFRRLQVKNRSQAVSWARTRGLL